MIRDRRKLLESVALAAHASECLRGLPLAHNRHPCARCGQSADVRPDGSYEVSGAEIAPGQLS